MTLMTRPAVRRSGTAGFTLIETLIATALMVAILAALATVTAQWLPNWNRGFARVQRTELAGLGLERVVADVAVAEFVSLNADDKAPLFEGAELAVTFVRSAIGPNAQRQGLDIVRIAETSDARGLALVRMRAPFVPLAAGGGVASLTFSDPVVLLRAPYRISFSYAGADRVWRGTWQDTKLPTAIRVMVRDAATAEPLAISTATMVHVNLAAECVKAQNVRDCEPAKADTPNTPAAPNTPGVPKPGAQTL